MNDYDPSDLDRQEADGDLRRATSELASENSDADFVWLMSGPKGRRIVCRLLNQAGVFRSSWSPNAMQMAKQEGQKEMGYGILSMIERLCPAEYHTMLQERTNDGRRSVAGNRS